MSENNNLPVAFDESPSVPVTVSRDQAFRESVDTTNDRSKYVIPKDFGKQLFLGLAGISLLILTIVFAWGFLRGENNTSKQADVQSPIPVVGNSSVVTTPDDRHVGVVASSSRNGVSLEVSRIDFMSRYTGLQVKVVNGTFEPVSFLNIMNSQLIDDKGNVYKVDFTTADDFITINPNTAIEGVLEFRGPIPSDVRHLTLVVNDVGTLRSKWYYELEIPL